MPVGGELLKKHFEKSGFGGYKTADVDSFMAELKVECSSADREITELKRKLETAEKKISDYESSEDSLKNTLLSAQKLADKIVRDARAQADKLLRETKESAELTINDAHIKAEKTIKSLDGEIELRKMEAAKIRNEVSNFKLSIMRLYKTHLELINELPSQPDRTDDGESRQNEKTGQDEKRDVGEDIKNSHPQSQNPEPPANAAKAESALEGHTPKDKPQEPKDAALQQKKNRENSGERPEPESADNIPGDRNGETIAESGSESSDKIKLNLRYNEKTGEYEPIGSDYAPIDNSGMEFGSNYHIGSGSSDEKSGKRKWRR